MLFMHSKSLMMHAIAVALYKNGAQTSLVFELKQNFNRPPIII
jgi:hypothetical protein